MHHRRADSRLFIQLVAASSCSCSGAKIWPRGNVSVRLRAPRHDAPRSELQDHANDSSVAAPAAHSAAAEAAGTETRRN